MLRQSVLCLIGAVLMMGQGCPVGPGHLVGVPAYYAEPVIYDDYGYDYYDWGYDYYADPGYYVDPVYVDDGYYYDDYGYYEDDYYDDGYYYEDPYWYEGWEDPYGYF